MTGSPHRHDLGTSPVATVGRTLDKHESQATVMWRRLIRAAQSRVQSLMSQKKQDTIPGCLLIWDHRPKSSFFSCGLNPAVFI